MAVGETKELTSVRSGGRVRGGAAAGGPSPPLGSKGRGLLGFRATKQWVEETGQRRGDKMPNAADSCSSKGAIARSPFKKEGRVQFKQENEHSAVPKFASPGLSPLRKDGLSDAQTAALSPISLNSLPAFRQPSYTSNSKPVTSLDNNSSGNQQTFTPIFGVSNALTDDKALQQAVPCVRNEGGERKLVWCNPTFCEDSEVRRFSNDSAASAQTTDRRSPTDYPKSLVSRGVGRGQDIPHSQQIRRESIGAEEESTSASALSSKINNGADSPDKYPTTSSAFSSSAIAGSPATAMVSTPENRGRSLRAQVELESASGNWYTPVMASVTVENRGNSRCSDRLMDFSSRSKRTLGQLPPFKAGSPSPANHRNAPACISLSTREENLRESYRGRPSLAYSPNHATDRAKSHFWGSERRTTRKLLMQSVLQVEGRGSQNLGCNMARKSTPPRAGDLSTAEPAPTNFEEMVEADLEADITREIEEEIAKEILYLSQRLAALHARQEMRRVGSGEKSKVGHSCPQTPLRCAPSPPSEAPAVFTIEEEKPRPASECKRRNGRVIAAKFLQSATERSKSVQSVDRTSRRRLLSDSPFQGPFNPPRRSLGTPARLLSKYRIAPSSETLDNQRRNEQTEPGLNPTTRQSIRPKVSVEEYVRERSLAGGSSKSKNAVLKEVFGEDLDASRAEAAGSHQTDKLEKPHQHVRSLSMGSAIQSRYFPEFERKVDWVKTLRSEALSPSAARPSVGQLMDHSTAKPICNGTQDIHAWLRGNDGSFETEDEIFEEEPMISTPSRNPVQHYDESNSHTPRLEPHRTVTQQQRQSSPCVARTPTPNKGSRPWTTPTRNTPSAASARSCSPSVRGRAVPSRYGTPVRANLRTPGSSEKAIIDCLVVDTPVRKIDHALRSASKDAGHSSATKGSAVDRQPTIRKGYPGVAGMMSKVESGENDADVHCTRHHHHQSSTAGKLKDRKSIGISNESMRRKDNFEAEYEKFVESSEIVEKQVSQLYHAAMDSGLHAAEPSAAFEDVHPSNVLSSSAGTAPKHTFIRCRDLIQDKRKFSSLLKVKRTTGQSVLPPTDGQESDDSVLASSIPRTESSEHDLEEELISEERSADEQRVEHAEVKLNKSVHYAKQMVQPNESTTSGCMTETVSQCGDTLVNERQYLPKIRAKSGCVHQLHDESPRDSGCVKRTSDQPKVHPFSEHSKGQPRWQSSDNEGLSPDEIEGLDLESFWCLVGELEGPIMMARP